MRKALVIGVGGTGAWALTHLKNRLLTDARYARMGSMGASAGEQASAVGAGGWDDTLSTWPNALLEYEIDAARPSVGEGTSLVDGEFQHVTGMPLGRTLEHLQQFKDDDSDAKFKEIREWLPHRQAACYDLQRAQQFLIDGAGEVRQYGRVVLFLDETQSGKYIRQKLVTELRRLTTATVPADGDSTNYIYVVGSLAGGTGGGMLLDIMGMLHQAEDGFPGQRFFNTGYLVLPTYYTAVLKDPSQVDVVNANGYGMARELERMMVAPSTVEFRWPEKASYQLTYAAFDLCYLVDGTRDDGGRAVTPGENPERGLPAAIADMVYASIFPSSGGTMSSVLSNLATRAVKKGILDRFSTFGSFSLTYAWDPTMRSLANRAAADVLGLMADAPGAKEAGEAAANEFVSGKGALGGYSSQSQREQVLPLLAQHALGASPSSPVEFMDQWSPGDAYLMPQVGGVDIPPAPTLRDYFQELNLSLMRKAGEHEQVIATLESTGDSLGVLPAFWGLDPHEVYQGKGDPTFWSAVNRNRLLAAAEFEKAVRIGAAAVSHRKRSSGGLAAARAFADLLQKRCETLSELTKARLAVWQRDANITGATSEVADAKKDMTTGGLWDTIDDAKEQARYIDAQQTLLGLQLDEACIQALQTLCDEFGKAAGRVVDEIDGWKASVQVLKAACSEDRRRIDEAREQLQLVMLQDYYPQPNDTAEEALYKECAGEEGARSHLLELIDKQLGWDYHESEKHPLGRIIYSHTDYTGKAATNDEPGNMAKGVVVGDVMPLFVDLRKKNLFEILELEGEAAQRVADRIMGNMGRLSNHDPLGGIEDGHGAMQQEMDFIFAYWPTQGPGSALASSVHDLLARRGLGLHDLGRWAWFNEQTNQENTFNVDADHCASDKLIALSMRHLAKLGSFTVTNLLRDSYLARRDRDVVCPSPHLFAEEQAAAHLELLSEGLYRAGSVKHALSETPPALVPLARDQGLLQMAATCLAYGQFEDKGTKGAQGTAEWYVTGASTAPFFVEKRDEPGAGSLVEALQRLLKVAERDAEIARGRAEVRTRGLELQQQQDAKQKLLDFAKSGSDDVEAAAKATNAMLMVAAAVAAAAL